MSPLHLILKEIWHHRWNSLWTALVLTAAVTLLMAIRLTADAAERETRRVMRDLGFNLRIIPAGTDTAFLWSKGYPDLTMPESHARQLAEQKGVFLTFNHLTATLRQRYPLARGEVLLEGVSPSISDEGKKPMGYSIPKGSLFLGHHAAQLLQAQRGQPVQLGGRTFQVERVLAESGTEDDIRVYAHLADAQAILTSPVASTRSRPSTASASRPTRIRSPNSAPRSPNSCRAPRSSTSAPWPTHARASVKWPKSTPPSPSPSCWSSPPCGWAP